ncbi:MAG TPA: large conductance mechanosensitive channel protein MscL [Candidatus Acidoferrales bacterium]|nr:large conductance mechanosensitive channel protein MscL [Candidatus Acidoferrales bacterium]
MSGFKAFVLRGNVVDLAVGIVIGIAFGVVIQALVKDLITPIIAAIGAQPNFSSLTFTINHSKFMYGDFIDAVIAFVILAAVVYYFVVLPYTHFRSRLDKPAAPTRECPECLSSVPASARRCAYCTTPLAPSTAA